MKKFCLEFLEGRPEVVICVFHLSLAHCFDWKRSFRLHHTAHKTILVHYVILRIGISFKKGRAFFV